MAGDDHPFQELPDDGDPEGIEVEEEASAGVLAAAEQFFAAVASGDARRVWELFSDTARAYIINIGQERGMEFDLCSRLRQGTAGEEESADFLGDVLAGLQHDLSGIDFARLAFDSKAEVEAPMQMRVTYLVQVGVEAAGLATAIPAGSIVLSLQDDEWRVERLQPRPGPAKS